MNTDITVILFDLGRVLMHIDFDAFPNALDLSSEDQRAPYRTATAKLTRVYETGKITTEEFLEALYVLFESRYSKEKILEAWNSIIVEDNLEIIPLVKKIQQQYVTAILSNTCESHWQKVIKISPLTRSFHHTFTSFHLGAMKPERIVYETVCTALSVQPRNVLFIDDLQENVDGAISAGMKGILFSGVEKLTKELTNL
ncbi:MAG: HAD family phosphatase [Bacteroidota bacterium]|nr:HAD family phosphatase [Bacteroidota bacterium]